MRIISQNKDLDIPYDSVVIQRFHVKIYSLNKNLMGTDDGLNDFIIGSYDSEDEAKKVMVEIQEAYRDKAKYFYMP